MARDASRARPLGRKWSRLTVAAAACLACVASPAVADDPFSTVVPLHGDVDKLGYVYANIKLEEPTAGPMSPHRGLIFRVVVDSSTDLTSLPCTGCTVASCGERRMERLVNREHETRPLFCYDSLCPEISRNCSLTVQGKPNLCYMHETFPGAEDSFLDGIYSTASVNLSDFRAWVTIGCSTSMGTVFQEQFADGTLGMGRHSPLLLHNADLWGVCLAPAGFYGGKLTVARGVEIDDDAGWLPLVSDYGMGKRESFWSAPYGVALERHAFLNVGDRACTTEESSIAVINTGSPLSWLPSAHFGAARSQFFAFCDSASSCPGQRVTGDAQFLACYNLAQTGVFAGDAALPANAAKFLLALQNELDRFPTLTFLMRGTEGNPFHFQVSPREYMYHLKEAVFCAGFTEDKAENAKIVLGTNVLRGKNVTFDLRGEQVQFGSCTDGFPAASDFEDTPDAPGEIRAQAGIGGFFGGFCVMLLVLCSCRCACRGNKDRYQALDEFGTGEAQNRQLRQDVEMATRKFSIGSDDDDDDDDGSIPSAYHHELSDDEDLRAAVAEGGLSANGFSGQGLLTQSDAESDDDSNPDTVDLSAIRPT